MEELTTSVELLLLSASVGIAFGSPYLLSEKVVEFLVPSPAGQGTAAPHGAVRPPLVWA